ncbi:MAG: hypothetical protein U9N81_05355 [Bacillota bacterium]|nr:hypothetical protein [Bacillota bacterium]
MVVKKEFSLLENNTSLLPHRFIAFNHNPDEVNLREIAEQCLEAWRINMAVYRSISDTGFSTSQIKPLLNELGEKRLPKTPPNDKNITKNPYITDVTEILSLRLIKEQHENAVFPYPRIFHKELRGNQHKGIDLIGYIKTPAGHILLIMEVMASVESHHPAGTVRDHLKQLLDNTLDSNDLGRLINELEYIHDEAGEEHRNVINGFLTALLNGQINNKEDVWALPVLIRPINLWAKEDWLPFMKATKKFEDAKIPSTVYYYALECNCTFDKLFDLIKNAAVS